MDIIFIMLIIILYYYVILFLFLNRAYDTLGDHSKRKNYDEFGMSGDQSDQYKNYYNQNGGAGSK